jgi:LPP20 lipoprotein
MTKKNDDTIKVEMKLNKLLLVMGLFVVCGTMNSQTVNEIKENKMVYIWGEGTGNTIKDADNQALSDLTSQISAQVESNFEKNVEQTSIGSKIKFKETVNDVIKTYSNATLKNTERLVLENEPNAKVFRYIKRSEVRRIFESRKNKVLELARNAEEALSKLQIADALRYFYWAQTLLRSHPDASDISYATVSGSNALLITWLPEQINMIFRNLEVTVNQVDKKETYTSYLLDMKYNHQPVQNFDYTYWSGQDWSNVVSAKDGIGVVELPKVQDNPSIRLKAEYVFENESNVDLELRDIMQKLPEVAYKNSYVTVSITNNNTKSTPHEATTNPILEGVSTPVTNSSITAEVKDKSTVTKVTLTPITNTLDKEQVMKKVISAITNRTYEAVTPYFTSEGLSIFQSLLQYGNARILKLNPLKYYQFNELVVCRSIPMSFNFKSNNRTFVEDVVFYFDDKNKISNISFALDQRAVSDIASKENWSEQVRMQLINFMENYKTAYALKRMDYLEKIFSDDALIITGRVTKLASSPEMRFMNNEIVKYNKQTKAQYLKNLKYSFGSNEFINLRLTDNTVKQSGKSPQVYGIQIKQDYFSSSYGDSGYLFLLIDFANQENPQIHVRTWQPQKNPDGSIYGLSDF